MQILQLLISLSLLVVIHEMGHFIFARLFGVRVERFSLFFGKPLLRFKPKRSETEYVVGWIPFGGYVELSGMIDESLNMEQMQQPPQPWEFRTKPAWQRLLIMVGGVLFNLIIACFIYAMVLFHWGDTYRTLENPKYGMEFNERAEAMGFRDGDILLRADDTPLKRYDENMLRALVAAHEVTVLRQGVEHIITMPEDMSLLDFGKDVQPFIDYYVPLTLDSVAAGTGAAQAGLQAGDRIISINGKAADTRTVAAFSVLSSTSTSTSTAWVSRAAKLSQASVKTAPFAVSYSLRKSGSFSLARIVVSETPTAFAAARTDPVATRAARICSLFFVANIRTPSFRGSFQK